MTQMKRAGATVEGRAAPVECSAPASEDFLASSVNALISSSRSCRCRAPKINDIKKLRYIAQDFPQSPQGEYD